MEIWNLFQDWEKNPIKTVTKTLPIDQLTLPNITVCPPEESVLNLNYDIVESEKVEIDNESRQELIEYAVEIVQDFYYAEMMRNVSVLENPDRNYNWYKGYSRVHYPFFLDRRMQFQRPGPNGQVGANFVIDNQIWFSVFSSATSGNISTKDFGKLFDEEKIEKDIFVQINVYPPESVKGNTLATMTLDISKVTIQAPDEDPVMKLTLTPK